MISTRRRNLHASVKKKSLCLPRSHIHLYNTPITSSCCANIPQCCAGTSRTLSPMLTHIHRRGDALVHSVRSSPMSALSFAATLTLHMHTAASRPTVRTVVVMRSANASAGRGDAAQAVAIKYARGSHPSARAALLSIMALERLMRRDAARRL